MTVGQLEQRLKDYPREATVLIAVDDDRRAVPLQLEILKTFVTPDYQSVPMTVILQPMARLSLAKAEENNGK